MNNSRSRTERTHQVPLGLKWAYSAFMLVLVPVYWTQYGPTNFLYFCDLALFLTWAGIWTENRWLISVASVGILAPQALWCLDFVFQLAGFRLTGMTAYMFDGQRSLFLRGLSLFHGWLPFLLVYLLRRVGYDRRALPAWTAIAYAACLISYCFLPGPSPENASKPTPCNVNYVWGMDDAAAQTWMPANAYLVLWMVGLLGVVYLPTHFLLVRWLAVPSTASDRPASGTPALV